LCKGFSDTDMKYFNTKLLFECRSETVTVDIVANHSNTSDDSKTDGSSNIIIVWDTIKLANSWVSVA
jgi:hypothetical protein